MFNPGRCLESNMTGCLHFFGFLGTFLRRETMLKTFG